MSGALKDGLYRSVIQTPWDSTRWPNFMPREIACQDGDCVYCGGSTYLDLDALDKLQSMRHMLNTSLYINSGHRCPEHNKKIGGASASAHLKLAFDIGFGSFDRYEVFSAAIRAGFSHFGFMKHAIHLDTRPLHAAAQYWSYGPTSRELWKEAWQKASLNPKEIQDIGGV